MTSIGDHPNGSKQKQLQERPTPLPKKQMLALCIARLAEPIAFSVIFPFINESVEALGIVKNPADVGFYSGVIEGAFATAQVFTVYGWGSLSDRVGRKPVILVGLLGVACSIILFGGLSNSFWGMVFARGLNGLLSGNASVIKAALGEVTDLTNEGLAFPLFSLQWSLGLVLGPLIGGFTSRPNDRFPSIFHNNPFLAAYPYFLPCFIAGSITLLGSLLTGSLLEETLERKVLLLRQKKEAIASNSSSSPSGSENTPLLHDHPSTSPSNLTQATLVSLADPSTPTQWTFWTLIKLPNVKLVLTSYFFLSWLANSYDCLFVLFAYSSPSNGGLSLPATQIATIMSLGGIFSALFQTLLLPRLHFHHGTSPLYILFLSFYPFVFALPPLIALTPAGTWRWIGVGTLVATVRIGAMGFPLNMIALNAAAPEKSALGAVNAIAQLLACASRSVGPMVAGGLYALSNRWKFPVVWLFYGSFSLLSIYLATKVKGRAELGKELEEEEGVEARRRRRDEEERD